ncbi:hypothetical protein [Catenisphaera adipataccumulans]|uniref:Heme A synthase n=1 Tax=Catenisphaera adipataccumulans TaxID=700500 RepID=A0A7W8CXM1_9FIRM|nr:hypothetical protein [Catenisphaera adipataccumulans]MBB5182313.1 heme A synthase [Catenisphaera adipataccumulans]
MKLHIFHIRCEKYVTLKGLGELRDNVSLIEIVATKILFAVLFALIYWMWVRSSYDEGSAAVGRAISAAAIFLLFVHYWRIQKYKKERFDEMAEQNLKRCDAICLKILTVFSCLIALVGGTFAHISLNAAYMMGWAIVASLLFLSVLRTILFLIMDKKGA